MKKVLFISSCEQDIRDLIEKSNDVWNVSTIVDTGLAATEATANFYDFIFFDIGLSGAYSPDILYRIMAEPKHPPVFMLSREYSFNFINLAHKAGACGYFHIPYNISILVRKIDHFFESLEVVSTVLPENIQSEKLNNTIIGKSQAMQDLRSAIFALRNQTEPVMIYGETGSGKELVARMIHENSPVSRGPFTVLNVSCITHSLAESTLFGSLHGSYTDAPDSMGLFEESNNGTLFLDEIGELDRFLQPKFLRVLEDKRISRVGTAKYIDVDFRLICATNKPMRKYVEAGVFRDDLFYRIDVLRIFVPPLREHPEDIPFLVSSRLLKYKKMLSNDALEKLHCYEWPGNVRQLFNCISRAASCSLSDIIYSEQIQF